MTVFDMYIFYGTLLVSKSGWDDEGKVERDHFRQGFAWYTEGVMFMIPDATEGRVRVEIEHIESSPSDDESALRVIEVPYNGSGSDRIYTYTSEELPFELPAGSYRLRYELHPGFEEVGERFVYRIKLSFIQDPQPEFRIVKSGHGSMTADTILRTDVSLM